MEDQPGNLAAAAAGQGFAMLFRALKAARPERPIHPAGVALSGMLQRHGLEEPTGVEWIDAGGADQVTARLSRSLGLPAGWPDILGLALRVPHEERHLDILLASTGATRTGRFVLTMRRSAAAGPFTSLMPYRTARGPLLLAARPVRSPGKLPADAEAFRRSLGEDPWTLGLYHAGPLEPWTRFATLALRPDSEPADTPARYDPVLNPIPGAGVYGWTRQLREPSYSAARQPRGS